GRGRAGRRPCRPARDRGVPRQGSHGVTATAPEVTTTPEPLAARPDADSAVLLRLTDVHTYYGHIHALQGVSLEVRTGEVVTLLGANGAGKTTTLKTIHGLLRAREGRIEFDGRDITGIPAH